MNIENTVNLTILHFDLTTYLCKFSTLQNKDFGKRVQRVYRCLKALCKIFYRILLSTFVAPLWMSSVVSYRRVINACFMLRNRKKSQEADQDCIVAGKTLFDEKCLAPGNVCDET